MAIRKLLIYSVIAILLLGIGFYIGKIANQKNESASPQSELNGHENDSFGKKRKHKKEYQKNKERYGERHDFENQNQTIEHNNFDIPSKAYKIRDYVKQNKEAMDGYVGGRKFKNLEKILPKNDQNNSKIDYHEWDVNPKIDGKNRGRERLVTGSDGNAYYTNDHYKSFKKLTND